MFINKHDDFIQKELGWNQQKCWVHPSKNSRDFTNKSKDLTNKNWDVIQKQRIWPTMPWWISSTKMEHEHILTNKNRNWTTNERDFTNDELG